MIKPLEQIKLWQAEDVEVELLAVWNPNEEQDPWARFRNTETQQEYTCRLEAFRARYQPIVNH